MKIIALIAVVGLPLAACSSGNDRMWTGSPDLKGGAVYLDSFQPPSRRETAITADAPSLTGIERSNWAPMTVVSPVDGVSATRTYTDNHRWTSATARQRGQMPTAVSSLEVSGDSEEDQMWEAVVSGPLAFVDALMIIPRMITHSPTREVRYFPEEYWRAPAQTARKAPSSAPTDSAEAVPQAEMPAK